MSLRHIVAPFKLVTNTVKQMMKMIFLMVNSLLKMFGLQAVRKSTYQPESRAKEMLSEVKNSMSDTQKLASDNILKPTSDAGHALWRYACAKSDAERAEIDLSALSEEQRDWLLMLSDNDLARLAKAGIDACTSAAAGKRCGVVRLPAINKHEQKDVYAFATPLAERIHAYRSPVFA